MLYRPKDLSKTGSSSRQLQNGKPLTKSEKSGRSLSLHNVTAVPAPTPAKEGA